MRNLLNNGEGLTLKAVLIFLIITNILTATTFFFYNVKQQIFWQKFSFVDKSRYFISQKDFFKTIQPLREDLIVFVNEEEKKGNEISLYFEYLNTGSNIAVNKEKRIFSASLIKIPVAIASIKKIETGEWGFQDEIALIETDINSESGDLYKKPVGSKFTKEFLIKKLIVDSDNTAMNMLMRKLGENDFQSVWEGLGLEGVYNQNGEVDAKEYSRIIKALYFSSFLNIKSSEFLLDCLSKSKFRSFLGAGVPDEVVFAHKYGVNMERRSFADSGIFYVENRPYLITVLIRRNGANVEGDTEEVKRIMKTISEHAYKYVAEY